jgi:hypothetical protein
MKLGTIPLRLPSSPATAGQHQLVRSPMARISTTALAALIFGCGSAFAQTTPGLPSIGMTSPLGIGPSVPVPPTRIPLGSVEMRVPGVSPLAPGTSPAGLMSGTNVTCGGIGGSVPEASFGMTSSTTETSYGTGNPMAGTSSGTGTSTDGTSVSPSVFDGGGTTGTASGTCPVTAGTSLGNPAESASSPTMNSVANVGRIGIPLGATELGAGGLGPMPSNLSLATSSVTTLQTPGTAAPALPSLATSSATTLQTLGTTAPALGATSLRPTTGSTTTGNSLPSGSTTAGSLQ